MTKEIIKHDIAPNHEEGDQEIINDVLSEYTKVYHDTIRELNKIAHAGIEHEAKAKALYDKGTYYTIDERGTPGNRTFTYITRNGKIEKYLEQHQPYDEILATIEKRASSESKEYLAIYYYRKFNKPVKRERPDIQFIQDNTNVKIPSGPAVNTITHALPSRLTNDAINSTYGYAVFDYKNEYLKIDITGRDHPIAISSSKTFNAILIYAREKGLFKNGGKISMPLSAIKALRGISDNKVFKEQTDRALGDIKRIVAVSYRNNKTGSHMEISPYGGDHSVDYVKGRLDIQLNPLFCELMDSYNFMYISKRALTYNDRKNPNSYLFYMHLITNYQINNDQKRKSEVKINDLIKASPQFINYAPGVTRYRDVVNAFERDMDNLAPDITWEYIGDEPLTYANFINTYIKYNVINYPDTSEYDTRRKKYRTKKTKRKPSIE